MSDSVTREIAAEPPAAAPARSAQRSMLVGFLCAALGAALFSTKGIIIKFAYAEGLNAETLLALRMALSLPVYAGVGWLDVAERRRRAAALPDWRLVLQAGLVGILGYWFASYTDFLGLIYISAQFERLILFTYPAFVLIFGALFFGQPIRARAVVGIAISYAGLALIFTTNLSVLGTDVAKGASLVLLGALGFALYQLLAKALILRIGPRLFTCIAMTGAAFAALLQFALTQPLRSILVSHAALLYGVLIAIVATVIPTFLLNFALQRISAQANATIGTVSPVVTIVLAVVLLGEDFTVIDACGTAMVLAGVAWFSLMERRAT
jgi:drug/metabolite transporter (DMT)-like permease